MTSPLYEIIESEITTHGPISMCRYMELALTHPEHGYYQSQDAIGASGDFITAPEISQMFGELCGLWGLDQMISQNIDDIAGWMELGPGRGVLMADIIRVCQNALPQRSKDWPVHLIDINKTLITQQQDRLGHITDLHHHADLKSLPEIPLVIMANEFFDALPIRQYITHGGVWFERQVTVGKTGLELTISDQPADKDVKLPIPTENGQVAEVCENLPTYVQAIASHINTYGGAALIIDYGKDNAIGDSIQAVMAHQPVDIFDQPGRCDLSAWVDFSAIRTAAIAAGAKVIGPQSQGEFLKQLGLYKRAEQLAIGSDSEERRKIAAAVDRLSSPAQMGGVFNVMAILPADHPANQKNDLAGFAT